MFEKSNFRSIGILDNQDGSKTLTPVFNGNTFPIKVKVTLQEFILTGNDPESMKELACEKLNAIVY